MALQENVDFVFIPVADNVSEKVCLVGTKKYVYVVPDQKTVNESSLKEFVTNAFAGVDKVESFNFGDYTPREVIAGLLADQETTLESLDEFFKNFKEKWDAVMRIEIASLKNFKVVSNIFGGAISVRYEGKKLFSPIVTRIAGKTERRGVKAFYEGITK
ncbi:MAG TPA: hypothetical protein DCS93_04445 [Microscillaceae bacterium]|nr:hypothetical protein [Microscillaceae bacterium]